MHYNSGHYSSRNIGNLSSFGGFLDGKKANISDENYGYFQDISLNQVMRLIFAFVNILQTI